MNREETLTIISKVGVDSIPQRRRQALDYLAQDGQATTQEIAREMGLPTNSVRRTLEDLSVYAVVHRYPSSGQKGDR